MWNYDDGSIKGQFQAHGHRIRALAFSPDGEHLASAGEDKKINIWNIATGQKETSIEHGPGKVLTICFCGDGRLASGGSDNIVRVWDLNTQAAIANFKGHTGSVAALACDPAGKLLVSGSFDATVRVWQLDGASGVRAERIGPAISR